MTHVDQTRPWTLRPHKWQPHSYYCEQCGLSSLEAVRGKHLFCDDDAMAVKSLIMREPRDG